MWKNNNSNKIKKCLSQVLNTRVQGSREYSKIKFRNTQAGNRTHACQVQERLKDQKSINGNSKMQCARFERTRARFISK